MAKDPGRSLITFTFILLGIYNILLALSLFGHDPVVAGLEGFYGFVEDEFWLLTTLEFIAVVCLFVDLILIYDKLKPKMRALHLALAAIYVILLFTKIVSYWFGFAFNKMAI